jgi:hypothetical protein
MFKIFYDSEDYSVYLFFILYGHNDFVLLVTLII